jgi:hypothetical protein
MMKKKHKFSKGKWQIEGTTCRTAINCGAKHIAMVGYMECGEGDPRSIGKEEHAANAQLIAAAPEMLRTLEKVLGWGEVVFEEEWLEKIESVIHQATGRG